MILGLPLNFWKKLPWKAERENDGQESRKALNGRELRCREIFEKESRKET